MVLLSISKLCSRLCSRRIVSSKNTRPAAFHSHRAFTLLDLLIVISILGILSMIIIPQIGAMASQTKLNSAASEMIMAFQYAQTLAIEYQRPFEAPMLKESDPALLG